MRRRLPPLNSLKAFEAAARHTSFRGAAEELCVSHSAISHQIKQLEQFLKIELFSRSAHSVKLTEAGEHYYPFLRDAFDRLVEGTELLLAPHNPHILTIRVYNTFAIRWLIPRLASFQSQNPEIQVRLNTSLKDVDFSHEDIDVSIRTGCLKELDLHYDLLFSTEIFPVCSPSLITKTPGLKHPSDLKNHTILQISSCELDWKLWCDTNQIEGIDTSGGLVFDTYDHALSTAVEGLGVALAMRFFVCRDLKTGLLAEPFPGLRVEYPDSWYLVCKKDRSNTTKVEAFRGWLLEQVKQADSQGNI